MRTKRTVKFWNRKGSGDPVSTETTGYFEDSDICTRPGCDHLIGGSSRNRKFKGETRNVYCTSKCAGDDMIRKRESGMFYKNPDQKYRWFQNPDKYYNYYVLFRVLRKSKESFSTREIYDIIQHDIKKPIRYLSEVIRRSRAKGYIHMIGTGRSPQQRYKITKEGQDYFYALKDYVFGGKKNG